LVISGNWFKIIFHAVKIKISQFSPLLIIDSKNKFIDSNNNEKKIRIFKGGVATTLWMGHCFDGYIYLIRIGHGFFAPIILDLKTRVEFVALK